MWDIYQFRKDTPGCLNKLFFNSAGASLVPKVVCQSVIDFLEEENEFGGYRLAEIRKDMISEFYQSSSELINGLPRNMAFTTDATTAYARALSAIPFKSGDTILTTDDDYVSNHLHFISLQQRLGINVIRVLKKEDGELDFEDMEQKLDQYKPVLVSVTHVPYQFWFDSGCLRSGANL